MIVVIDYYMGNVRSVQKAFQKIGYKDTIVSRKPGYLRKAERIILPGVGSYFDGIQNLTKLGLIEVLNEEILDKKKPFLGICLGMQLLSDEGEEGNYCKGIGWIPGKTKRMEVESLGLRLPHMGWDNVFPKKDTFLFQGIEKPVLYFVHSYFLECTDKSIVTSECEYGQRFASSVKKDNIFATQFHPEKSQVAGLKILQNFLRYGGG